jgi:hypothetical protein
MSTLPASNAFARICTVPYAFLKRLIATLPASLVLFQTMSSPCFSQAPVVSGDEVAIDLASETARLTFQNEAGAQRHLSFNKDKKVKVRTKGEEQIGVRVWKNPVLFSYVAKDVIKTPTDSQQAADKLAGALAGVIGDFEGSIAAKTVNAKARGLAPERKVTRVKIDGLDLFDLARRVRWVGETWDSLPDAVDQTLDPASVPLAKERAARWKSDLRKNDPTETLASVPPLWRKLISATSTFTVVLEYETDVSDSLTVNRVGEIDAPAGESLDKWDFYVGVILAIESERRNILAQVADIADLSNAIEGIRDETLTSISPHLEENQEQPIEITANARFSPLLSQRATTYQAARTGTYSITFVPHELIHMRPSAGVIYSFVKAPTFSAERDASGQLHIAGNADEYSKYSGLIAVDFIPDTYFYSGVQLFGQLGVAPSSDNLGFVLGAGVRAYKSFTFSLGIVYQRVDKLSGSLKIGDPIQQESDLKTSREFKTGLYLGLAVKLD